jgi:hypothetical protein
MVAATVLLCCAGTHSASCAESVLDPYELQEAFSQFPFAKVIPLDDGEAWGLMYADVYGKLHLFRSTEKGWRFEWELTNLGSKIRKFFVDDIALDGRLEIIVVTVNGRILIYRMDDYVNVWENIEDKFSRIAAMEIANIDTDPQLEFIVLADRHLYIFDGVTKGRQWVSEREFDATEIIIDNVDKDDQLEIIFNSGIVLDTRFFNVELEWDRSFGDRIMTFDMNSDGYPEVIGEFSDYSLRIFDVYAQREVW